MTKPYTLDVVVPCFNEVDALPLTAPRLVGHFRKLLADPTLALGSFRIIIIDDGSRDGSWLLIDRLRHQYPEIEGLKLARNFGHQAALLAGLTHSTADAVISIDADLQDDLTATTAMLQAFEGGAQLALGVRSDRSSDSAGKRFTARAYYRLLARLGASVVHDHADFRLMARPALDALLAHREVNLFLRGLIPTLGFPVTLIPYARHERVAGETKYPLRKMLGLAIDGVTSFSVAPLRMIALLGGLIFIATTLLSGVFLWMRLFQSAETVPGWASTVLPVLFLGGMQLLSTGVLGEYVGKIYLETKRRPRFIVEQAAPPAISAPAIVEAAPVAGSHRRRA